MLEKLSLQDKTILITGGTRGIGFELIKQCLEKRGVKKIISTGRSTSSIESAYKKLNNLVDDNKKVQFIVCDLAQSKDRMNLVKELNTVALDGIIHNAGMTVQRDLAAPNFSTDSMQEEMIVNFVAPVELTQQLMVDPNVVSSSSLAEEEEVKEEQQSKSTTDTKFVCFVTSGLALTPKKTSPIYCASKAALHSYVKSLRATLKGTTDMHVLEALPPAVATEMHGVEVRDDMMAVEDCAKHILDGIETITPENMIGKTNLLHWMLRLLPSYGESLVINGV